MFPAIVKDWNATESFEFHGVIGRSILNESKRKSSKLRPIYLCSH